MVRKLILVGLVLASASAGAELPLSQLVNKSYVSAERAALEGLLMVRQIQRQSPELARWEFGGVVVELKGRYFVTSPATQKLSNHIEHNFLQPVGSRVVARYHSHPSDPYFSPADKRLAGKSGLPSYLVASTTGKVLRYDPGSRGTTALGAIAPWENGEWGFWEH